MRLWPRKKPPPKSEAECEAEELQERADKIARRVDRFASGVLHEAWLMEQRRKGAEGAGGA